MADRDPVLVLRRPRAILVLRGGSRTAPSKRRATEDGHRRTPDVPSSSEAIIKPLNVVEGLAEFPWHRDCSFGGHPYGCASYAVGLPLRRESVRDQCRR